MQASLWKILSWEWVSEIAHVLETQHHDKDDCAAFLCWRACVVLFHVTDKIQNRLNALIICWTSCRSSPSPVCAMKLSCVLPLTIFFSTECCSRSTRSNCSPPTASSITSVSFSSPLAAHGAAVAPLSVSVVTFTGSFTQSSAWSQDLQEVLTSEVVCIHRFTSGKLCGRKNQVHRPQRCDGWD